MDNLRNSFPKAFEHMKRIAGDKADKMKFVKVSTPAGTHAASTRQCACSSTAPALGQDTLNTQQQQQHHQQPPPSRTLLLNPPYRSSSAMCPVPSPKAVAHLSTALVL